MENALLGIEPLILIINFLLGKNANPIRWIGSINHSLSSFHFVWIAWKSYCIWYQCCSDKFFDLFTVFCVLIFCNASCHFVLFHFINLFLYLVNDVLLIIKHIKYFSPIFISRYSFYIFEHPVDICKFWRCYWIKYPR